MQILRTGDMTPEVTTFIQVDPDRLIEIGHRLKAYAMDNARVGESVTIQLTDKITLLFEPSAEFQKPFQTYGDAVRPQATPEAIQ